MKFLFFVCVLCVCAFVCIRLYLYARVFVYERIYSWSSTLWKALFYVFSIEHTLYKGML